MKNLGKMILFFLISLPLWAEVRVSVDKEQITRGERITLTLHISGAGEIEVPPLNELCGYSIEGRMQSRKEVFSNGKRVQEHSVMYEFMPEQSCVIEPFPVIVNGKEEMTNPINITVSKMAISKNDPFIVKLATDKQSVYVGEPFEVKVDFKVRRNIEALAESISLPENKNIWVKSEEKGKPFVQDEYAIRKNQYAMAAQQSGKLSLGPLRWDVKVRSQSKDYWGTWLATTKTRTVFSNELDIEVKALPEAITLVGEMDIDISVNQREVNAGEAVNVTLKVEGKANIEDIEAFDIHIDGAQVFKEDPTASHYLQEGKYFGSFVQKLALVAENDFIIPSFELKYMDVKTDTVKTIKTEPISIKVLNPSSSMKEELKIARAEERVDTVQDDEQSSLTYIEGILLFVSGMVLGVVFSMIPWKTLLKKEKKKSVSVKESKDVLQLLMSHMGNDGDVEEMVKKLSENIYEGASHPVDKKKLQEMVKRVQE